MEPSSTTLADALLDDLDDLSDVEEQEEEEEEENPDNDDEEEDERKMPAVETSEAGIDNDGSATTTAVQSTAKKKKKFSLDSGLLSHVEAVRAYKGKQNAASTTTTTKDEQEEEHRLIVRSNKELMNLVDELARAHGDLCLIYKPKFPELEELLPNPIQYKNAVRVIWNEMDMTRVNEELNEFLSANQIITISVAGSSTGRPLEESELKKLEEVLAYMEEIVEMQKELTEFVESRMESLAPSVCALIGPSTAARFIGLAGGLAELSRIPACNLQVLGQVKHNASSRAGLSSLSTRPHTGILAECDLVQRCPRHYQKKALKAVAAKLALAIRCDFVNVDSGRPRSDASGLKFRQEIEKKMHTWMEPDKAPVLKALPKPDLTIKKRRGGKRMRRLKERFEETAMMKQANTRAFSTQAGEYGDDAMGLTMGLLDTADASGGGALRKTTEKRKMRQANTKASRKRAAQMKAATTTSGLASSMVFTPVQGMELVNPDANKERVREANKKWFNENAGFQSALPK